MLNLILGLLLALIAGFGYSILVVNRLLSYLRDGWRKQLSLILLFGGIIGGFLGIEFWLLTLGAGVLILVPLMLLFVGEFYLRWSQKRYKAGVAVKVDGNPVSLRNPVTTIDLQVYWYEIEDAKLPVDHLRVVHMSDFHVNQGIPIPYFHKVISRANDSEPDLIFLSGDFVTESRYIPWLQDILANLSSRLGAFAILGNHDYWTNPIRIADMLRGVGVTVLEDEPYFLRCNDHEGISIQGCERPWGRGSCGSIKSSDTFSLALSHTGDYIYALSNAGINAVFSGHFHAGQFQIPGFGPVLLPSKYGRRFAHGHYLVKDTHLFVSAGVGAGGPPLRLYCPPDFFVVDFYHRT